METEEGRLKNFLKEYLVRILANRNSVSGPYRYWIQNTDERGYIGINTIMNANVMKRSEQQHDVVKGKGQGYFRRVLKEVLSEPPFEVNAGGTRWRYTGEGASMPVRPANAPPAGANVWAQAGARQLANASTLSANAGTFVPGAGVQYNEWDARAPHKSAENAFEARALFTLDKSLPPLNITPRPNLQILPTELATTGGRHRTSKRKTQRRKARKVRTRRHR